MGDISSSSPTFLFSWSKSTHKQTFKRSHPNKPLRETLPNLKKLKNCIKYKIFNENARKIPGNVRNKEVDLHYTEKRQKNNDAVKKSREKTRQKAKETMEKVTQLKQENEMLEERIKLLAKELTFLKDIFMAHAGSAHGITVDDMEIKGLLEEEEDLMSGSEY